MQYKPHDYQTRATQLVIDKKNTTKRKEVVPDEVRAA